MKITYLGNSGFALERDGGILVIDCYNPAQHPLLSDVSLSTMRTVTALISHSHSDHYSPDIWKLKNARFAAGFDVPAPWACPKCARANGIAQLLAGTPTAARTRGILPYHVDGVSVFHAGDLNDWHWRDEGGRGVRAGRKARFLTELERIKAGVKNIDLAFFPWTRAWAAIITAVRYSSLRNCTPFGHAHAHRKILPPAAAVLRGDRAADHIAGAPGVEKHMLCPIAR
jgi:L-ascorbate metabolism protein UlaG (beta-lactamase superfamily)